MKRRNIMTFGMTVPRAAVVAALAFTSAAPAFADADGPEYYRVRDLYPGAVLTLHVAADPKSKVLAWVPHNGNRMKNLGCKGGLNIIQWEKATPAQRRAGRFQRWCKVTYKGKTGWVNGGYLGE